MTAFEQKIYDSFVNNSLLFFREVQKLIKCTMCIKEVFDTKKVLLG